MGRKSPTVDSSKPASTPRIAAMTAMLLLGVVSDDAAELLQYWIIYHFCIVEFKISLSQGHGSALDPLRLRLVLCMYRVSMHYTLQLWIIVLTKCIASVHDFTEGMNSFHSVHVWLQQCANHILIWVKNFRFVIIHHHSTHLCSPLNILWIGRQHNVCWE